MSCLLKHWRDMAKIWFFWPPADERSRSSGACLALLSGQTLLWGCLSQMLQWSFHTCWSPVKVRRLCEPKFFWLPCLFSNPKLCISGPNCTMQRCFHELGASLWRRLCLRGRSCFGEGRGWYRPKVWQCRPYSLTESFAYLCGSTQRFRPL